MAGVYDSSQSTDDFIALVEQELGRPLSPWEIGLINHMLDSGRPNHRSTALTLRELVK